MAESHIALLALATGATELMAARGGAYSTEHDRSLLRRHIPPSQLSWRGGVGEDRSGNLVVVERASAPALTPSEAERLGELTAAAYRGFYELATDGIALTDVGAIREWFGLTLEQNYPEAGRAFLRFATTYWTFKVLIRQLDVENEQAVVRSVLLRIDDLLAELFFPTDGPMKVDPKRRELDQRRFLEAFGPRIDVADFISRNPILIRDRQSSAKRWISW